MALDIPVDWKAYYAPWKGLMMTIARMCRGGRGLAETRLLKRGEQTWHIRSILW